MNTKKQKRENMKDPLGFGQWKTIMAPSNDPCTKQGFKARLTKEGKRLKVNPFPNSSGLYEMRIIPPGYREENAIVLYLGKAGGDNIKSTLKTRINQYMANGSHKRDFYDAALKGGCKIQMRVIVAGANTRKTTGEEKAKRAESHYLKKIDYAANKTENGSKRYHEIKIKVNGKETTLDKFLVDNGYPKEKMEKWGSQSDSGTHVKATTAPDDDIANTRDYQFGVHQVFLQFILQVMLQIIVQVVLQVVLLVVVKIVSQVILQVVVQVVLQAVLQIVTKNYNVIPFY